jgi:hypothetical protein
MRSSSHSRILPLALLLLAACAQPKVVREGEGWRETESAVELTTEDPAILARIVMGHGDAKLRLAAVAKISDAPVLAEVARKDQDPALRKAAVERVDDEGLLADLAKSDADPAVQAAAAARRDVLRSISSRHPEYAAWASAKPGAWVKLRLELQMGDQKWRGEVVRKLVSCRPERAVFEQRDAATGRGPQGAVRELLAGYDVGYGQTEEDAGPLDVGGQRLRCRWTRWSFTKGRDIVRLRRWFHDSVPGGVARIDLEVAPLGDAQRVLTAQAIAWGP